MILLKPLVAATLLLLGTAAAQAGDLSISGAWIRLMPAGIPSAGYFTLHNGSREATVLQGAECAAYGHVMLHRSVEENGVSRMLMVKDISIAPGASLRFAPGGYHLMLMQPKQALDTGGKVPVTLMFTDGRRLTVDFTVRPPDAEAP